MEHNIYQRNISIVSYC